jgi:hypothetical protein
VLRQANVFYNYSERRGAGKRTIGSQKCRITKPRGGYIKSVVRANIMAMLPCFPEKRSMWTAVDRPFHKIFNREERTLLSELTAQHGAFQNR